MLTCRESVSFQSSDIGSPWTWANRIDYSADHFPQLRDVQNSSRSCSFLPASHLAGDMQLHLHSAGRGLIPQQGLGCTS